MAKGHKHVVRRSLTPEEWLRLRAKEIGRWLTVASAPTGRWQIREADYRGPGDYRWRGRWKAIREGEMFGAPDGSFLLRGAVTVPEVFKGLPVLLELATPTEMLVRLDGRLVNGIDPNRSLVPLVDPAGGGETFACELEAYMRSAPDDMRVREGPGWGCIQPFRPPRFVSRDHAVEQFHYDVQTALEVALCREIDEDVRELLLHHLDETMKLLDRDTDDRKAYHRSVARARAYLRRHVYERTDLAGPGRLALVGHSHVDVAYHWRVKQGIRKNARTAAVQLALMDEFPEMRYCHTQPYLYEQLKEHWPDLYERVKARVKSGEWELVGATYVEPDCNVPSAESLIRQCLYGQLFYLREFGRTVDTCWLPDVFGNSWVMPQILARSGIKYFVSNKMSTWNDTNRFPHTNFRWRGVDGTEVLACVPASHFNCWLAPDQLLANWEGFAEKVAVGESMNMFGFGDGGGGLTRELLEAARRLEAFPGLPRTRLVTAATYLDEAFADPAQLALWDDELYLEMHRGVTTTKGLLKKLNRQCELAARDAELWTVLAEPYDEDGTLDGAQDTLTSAWKQVLVNQFHDILPGSHTTPVGTEAEATYQEAADALELAKCGGLVVIADRVASGDVDGEPHVVFSPLAWARTGMVTVSVDGERPRRVLDSAGEEVPSQAMPVLGDQLLHFVARGVPPCGYATYFVQEAEPAPRRPLRATPRALENRFFRIRFNARGEITGLLDKRCRREVIAEGKRANRFQLFEDKPGNYDAWDIVRSYQDKEWDLGPLTSMAVFEHGPVRATLRITRDFLDSHLIQCISIYSDVPRIDFETYVDWRERNKLLKVAFPVSVLARHATYDLGYGSATRPTHGNTSWDEAKFEVCGHKWADLSEAGYGVSLLNDSKYGWDVRGNVIRLSLLRGSIRPDPDTDLGEHDFAYSLFPHAGTWQAAGTVRAAYELNSPLRAIHRVFPLAEERLPGRHSFLSVDAPNVHVGALKPAEEGEGAILRLVEQHGARGPVRVTFDRPLASVEACDLLERAEGKVETKGCAFTTSLRPFEIASFRIRFG